MTSQLHLPQPRLMASASELSISKSPSLTSQVHAAAINGDRSALQKIVAANPEFRDAPDQFGRTPLMYCVLADRPECAEALVKAGANVNKTDKSKRTALHLAAQKGNYRILKLLLSRRASLLQKDLEGMTGLHLATRHETPRCLALLLKHIEPGEVDVQDNQKRTALHWSAYYNHPEHVRMLIKHDSNIGVPDSEGKIPLHWAANNKDPSAVHTVRCLLEATPTDSILNWQDYEGRTPLHFAVADGNEAVVDILTSPQVCNVTAYDNLFRTSLHWAALLGHAKIVHLLLERNSSGTIPSDSQGATPLHYAAQSNHAETVEVFLSHPSVHDEPDLERRTAFMWAAGKGSDAVVSTMLRLIPNLDVNLADKYGGTALHAAALSGHVSTVRLLLAHGAQVDAANVMKHTPLFRACEMGHKEVIETLIEGGARVDLVDQDGHSPLHWAALGGNADICLILIRNGIHPDVRDHVRRTPLQCAAYGGYINCMVVLMDSQADPNIQDKEGMTALHWCCNNGYLNAVKLLLEYGAFPNHMETNEERYTPLDYALLGGHQEVIQYMLEHGALSIAAIQDIAATKIQAVYRGHRVRRSYLDRKKLLMKHEQLRKHAASRKREEVNRRKEAEQQLLKIGESGAEAQNQERLAQQGVHRKEPCAETTLEGGECGRHAREQERPKQAPSATGTRGPTRSGAPEKAPSNSAGGEAPERADAATLHHSASEGELRASFAGRGATTKAKSVQQLPQPDTASPSPRSGSKDPPPPGSASGGGGGGGGNSNGSSSIEKRSSAGRKSKAGDVAIGNQVRPEKQSGGSQQQNSCEDAKKEKKHHSKFRKEGKMCADGSGYCCHKHSLGLCGRTSPVLSSDRRDAKHSHRGTCSECKYRHPEKTGKSKSTHNNLSRINEDAVLGASAQNRTCSAHGMQIRPENDEEIPHVTKTESAKSSPQICKRNERDYPRGGGGGTWEAGGKGHALPIPHGSNIMELALEVRLQTVQRERRRKDLFRRKQQAATLIQRTWHRYKAHQLCVSKQATNTTLSRVNKAKTIKDKSSEQQSNGQQRALASRSPVKRASKINEEKMKLGSSRIADGPSAVGNSHSGIPEGAQSNGSEMAPHAPLCSDPDERWRREMAALTIQLAWKRFHAIREHREPRPHRSARGRCSKVAPRWDARARAAAQLALIRRVYGEPQGPCGQRMPRASPKASLASHSSLRAVGKGMDATHSPEKVQRAHNIFTSTTRARSLLRVTTEQRREANFCFSGP
uniref:Inversin isoform X1 n=1 Tax=Petromyzon marinus TaxID=7757 RepID=A0AAJ7SM27_PETMA|nr:inversin isoform X1 [Petromyzon marinus]